MDFDLENPLTAFDEHQSDTVPALFASELDHMPCDYYLRSFKTRDFDVSMRRGASSLILQVQLSCNFDRFIPYLAVNYFDRFVSVHGLPRGKPWILRLLALSCLSLAAKMKQTEFSLTDFQREGRFIFDVQTIQRMELLILGVLKWRMRSITPFPFVYFFLSLFKLKDPPLIEELKTRVTEIIFKAQNEITLFEFKPSIIASSAILCVSHELFPMQHPCFRKAIFSCEHVNKETLLDCCNVMQETVMDGYESTFDTVSSSDTPVCVLDHRHGSSSEGENTTTTTSTSPVASVRSERDIKRRKISNFCCDDKTFQLSQIQHC